MPRGSVEPGTNCDLGLQTISFRRCVVIAFAVHVDTVEIHGVFYGGQDYEINLFDRDA